MNNRIYQTALRVFRYIYKKVGDMRIGTKVALYYLIILVISIAVSNTIYQRIYSGITIKKVSNISVQTLSSISSNIETMLEGANELSKMLLSDKDIDDVLKNGKMYIDVDATSRMDMALKRSMGFSPIVSSIYLFDNSGKRYVVDKKTNFLSQKVENVKDMGFYQEAIRNHGGYILKLNADDLFTYEYPTNFVSLIRTFNSTESQKLIGLMIINISEDSFRNSYRGILKNYDTDIAVFDENNKNIVNFNRKNHAAMVSPEHIPLGQDYGTYTQKSDQEENLISYLKIGKYNWKIVSIMPFNELSKEDSILDLIASVIILFNSLFLFVGAVLLTRLITAPIAKLLKSMKGVKNGEFIKVEIKTGDNEIGELRDGYNIMITEIQNLIYKVIEEQKIKRKAELTVLQEQIKPHFLYNTFDAISYLALSGKNEEVYKVMVALGNFYRTSLSKGSDVVTIREEIETVKNYLIIQKVRYGDMFNVSYTIDDTVLDQKIPKLVLQPLVENAIYHGIKPKGETGTISISAKSNGAVIRLIVEDDGVGMDSDKLKQLTGERLNSNSKSFGLRGTFERLRIYYGLEDVYSLDSKVGAYTRVIITIPKLGDLSDE